MRFTVHTGFQRPPERWGWVRVDHVYASPQCFLGILRDSRYLAVHRNVKLVTLFGRLELLHKKITRHSCPSFCTYTHTYTLFIQYVYIKSHMTSVADKVLLNKRLNDLYFLIYFHELIFLSPIQYIIDANVNSFHYMIYCERLTGIEFILFLWEVRI
jgi:hypothetical protein